MRPLWQPRHLKLPQHLLQQERRVLQIQQFCKTQPDFILPAFRPVDSRTWSLGLSGNIWQVQHQQRLVMEVSWETLEHAGIAPDTLKGGKTCW